LLVIAAQILQMIRQLPPLVRFDGYHLLADVTGVPDLFHRIGPTLRSFIPGRRPVQALELKLWARIVLTLWVLLVVPLLLMTAVLAVVALPRIVGTTA
jgi:putative peptide zinc metalloprotease protein